MRKEEVNQVVKKLRSKGVRITPQRVAMLEFLASVDTHPTAEEIFTELKNQIVEENLHYSSNNYENYLQKTYLVLDLIKEYEETHKDLVDSDPSSETITEKHAVSYKGVKYPQNLTKESVDVQKKSAKIGEERETMPKSGHRIRGHPEIRAA